MGEIPSMLKNVTAFEIGYLFSNTESKSISCIAGLYMIWLMDRIHTGEYYSNLVTEFVLPPNVSGAHIYISGTTDIMTIKTTPTKIEMTKNGGYAAITFIAIQL